MFEIGNSLREARLRQGAELPRVEADTKIRAKYLRALEEERFDVLPGEAYVKGFLRTYAEYLGLEGHLYVDEFNTRFAKDDEPVVTHSKPTRMRTRAVESNFVVVALAAIVAVTVLFMIAWRYGTGQEQPGQLRIDGAPTVTNGAATTEPTVTEAAPAPTAAARKARLVLSAVRGDCWLQVKVGSATGALLYEGTLQAGQTQRFTRWRKLWIQIGAPSNVEARLNGRRVKNFPERQAIVVVTAKGARTVSTV